MIRVCQRDGCGVDISYRHSNTKFCSRYCSNKNWRSSNPDRAALHRRQYYERNKDSCAERRKEYYRENKEVILAKAKEYRNTNPDKVRESKRKYEKKNKDKIRVTRRKWREENPFYLSLYYAKNKDKMNARNLERRRKLGGIDRHRRYLDFLIESQDNICGLCRYPMPESKYSFSGKSIIDVDHIVPISRGGSNDLSNLHATHARCNRVKRHKLVESLVNVEFWSTEELESGAYVSDDIYD